VQQARAQMDLPESGDEHAARGEPEPRPDWCTSPKARQAWAIYQTAHKIGAPAPMRTFDDGQLDQYVSGWRAALAKQGAR
jgi:hypothetical protein